MNLQCAITSGMCDLLPIGICRIDSAYTVTLWNMALERWTGVRSDEITGKDIFSVFPDLDSPLIRRRIYETLESRTPQILSSRFTTRFFPVRIGGTEALFQKTSLIPDDNDDVSPGLLIVLEDVTGMTRQVMAYRQMKDTAVSEIEERKKTEEALSISNNRASLYLDIITRDINTLITSALGYNLLLFRDIPEDSLETATRLHRALKRSVRIIRNISTIRRIDQEAPVLRTMELDPLIRTEIGFFDQADIHYSGTGQSVHADDLFPELIGNLLENAIRHGRRSRMDIWISVCTVPDGYLEIRVEDNGQGVGDEEKETFFDREKPDLTRKGDKKLGLSIVRMLTDRYQGEVHAADRITGQHDQGLAVILRLPLP